MQNCNICVNINVHFMLIFYRTPQAVMIQTRRVAQRKDTILAQILGLRPILAVHLDPIHQEGKTVMKRPLTMSQVTKWKAGDLQQSKFRFISWLVGPNHFSFTSYTQCSTLPGSQLGQVWKFQKHVIVQNCPVLCTWYGMIVSVWSS